MGSPESMGGHSRNPEVLDGEPRSGSPVARDEVDDIIDRAVADHTGGTALFLHVLMLQTSGYTDAASERELDRLDHDTLRLIIEDLLELGAIEPGLSDRWGITELGSEAAWRLLS